MRLKRVLLSTLVVGMMVLNACTTQNGPDYTVWIPEHSVSDLNLDDDTITTQSSRVIPSQEEYTSVDEIAKKMLNHEDVFDLIYKNQLINGAYTDLSEAISSKRTIMYVSSSEGNDLNDGRTPQTAKKTFESLSQSAGIAILLRAGDTFEMNDMFYVGDNTVFCSYGDGPRPILDFSQKIEESFFTVRGYENLWAVDLSRTLFNNKDSSSNLNYNFGQLYIDGECNWNRISVPVEEMAEYNFAQTVSDNKDNCWIVDWMHGVLYLYSESNPNEHEVRVSIGRHGLNFKEVRNAIVSDLEIRNVGANGALISNCTDVSIRNCLFKNIGGAVTSEGMRYGSGVQLSSVAKGISIENNAFDWVYANGYIDAGITVTDRQENVTVKGNIFSHCYCGITQSDDFLSLVPASKFAIENNLVFEACDVTNPNQSMYADVRGNLLNGMADYHTYRNVTLYEKCSSATFSPVQVPSEFSITGNVFWQTNRFLLRVMANNGYPELKGNYFFSGADAPGACLFSTRIDNGEVETVTYMERLLDEANEEVVVDRPAGTTDLSYIPSEAMSKFKSVLKSISGE